MRVWDLQREIWQHVMDMVEVKGLCASSGVIERWELLRAQSQSEELSGPLQPQQLCSELDDVAAWLAEAVPELERRQRPEPAACSIQDMEARAKELRVRLRAPQWGSTIL